MQKRHRLTKNVDYKRVRQEGRSWAHPLLVLYATSGHMEVSRVGLSVSRRVGNSVQRNRVKRLLREAVRPRFDEIKPGLDLVIIARQPIARVSFSEVSAALEQVLRRAGLLEPGVS